MKECEILEEGLLRVLKSFSFVCLLLLKVSECCKMFSGEQRI